MSKRTAKQRRQGHMPTQAERRRMFARMVFGKGAQR